jgi:DNA-binding CsgD family transcriptional regulator
LPSDLAAIGVQLIGGWREVFVTNRTVQSGPRRTLIHTSLPGWQADVQLMIHPGDRLSHPVLAVRIHPPAPGPDIDATSLVMMLQRLTEAERAIARAVASGLDNRAIAATLHISVNTVRTHLRHIFRKLDIASRSHLAALLTAAGGEAAMNERSTTTASAS